MQSELRSLSRHRRDWEELAQVDPLWAVLTEPQFKDRQWDPAEFLARGEAEIASLMRILNVLGRPLLRRSALDFGCGAGRLSIALARRFDKVIGVDISETMIEVAKQNAASVSNVAFIVSRAEGLTEFDDASFDLVYSNLVLQHMPSQGIALTYIADFIRVLANDGIAVFQVPADLRFRSRPQLRRRLYRVLRGLGVSSGRLIGLGVNPMRLIGVPVVDVLSAVAKAGGEVIITEPDNGVKDASSSYRYYAIRGRD